MANKTSFKKGEGGRPKGVPNKATAELRDWISKFVSDQTEQIKTDWEKLDPKDRLIMFERLLKYVLPTLQATSSTIDFEKLSDEDLDRVIDGLKKSA